MPIPHPVMIGIAAFFVIDIGSSFLVGPTKCRDGWGKRGEAQNSCQRHSDHGLDVGSKLRPASSRGTERTNRFRSEIGMLMAITVALFVQSNFA
jgi:hypothetical protein